MTRANIEVEIKLIAPNAAALSRVRPALDELCSAVRHLGRETILDTYLDTPDWRLYEAGYACRIRRTGGRAFLVLKALKRARNMVSVREEIERRLRLPLPRSFTRLVARPAGDRVRQVIGDRSLRPIFRVKNRRRTYEAAFGKGLVAHVSLDDFAVVAGPNSTRLAEVEIEAKAGTLRELRRLARRLAPRVGLAVEARTKFREGLTLGGHKPGRRGKPSAAS